MQSHKILLSNKTQGEKQFRIGDIVYCQSNNMKLNFWFLDGTSFTVSGNISDFEELLSPYGFYRLQQSYLVNINYVDCVKRSERDVIMKNYPKLEIGASRYSSRWEKFIN